MGKLTVTVSKTIQTEQYQPHTLTATYEVKTPPGATNKAIAKRMLAIQDMLEEEVFDALGYEPEQEEEEDEEDDE